MARSHRRSLDCHRQRLCRWQSDVAVGKEPSADISSAKGGLPTANCQAIGKALPMATSAIGKGATSADAPSG